MSNAADVPMHTQPQAAPSRTRPFYWSLRRELWENHALWIAPLAVAGVILFGFSISLFTPHRLTTVNTVTTVSHSVEGSVTAPADSATPPVGASPDATTPPPGKVTRAMKMTPAQRLSMAVLPFDFAAVALIVTMFLVAVFYCLGALHNERRDRSILFWKSLPVPDLTTVLAKATVPMAVLPVVTVAVTVGVQLIMLAFNIAEWSSQGRTVGPLLSHIPLGEMTVVLVYGMATLTLWWAPVYAWLLLVSVWARRAPFLWAVLPPCGLALAERLAFGTTKVATILQSRIMGSYEDAFIAPAKDAMKAPGAIPTIMISQIDAAKFVTSPGLWIGLVVAVGLVALTVWLRRNREPL